MKEKPILFSAPMVRAILEEKKTQTRRVIKPQPVQDPDGSWRSEIHPRSGYNTEQTMRHYLDLYCPYGKPGDRLWVKETFGVHDTIICNPTDTPNFYGKDGVYHPVVHFAGKENYAWGMYGPPRKRSGRFMPRRAARIILEIVSVRVERVQEISHQDILAEGIKRTDPDSYYLAPLDGVPDFPWTHAGPAFASLWNSINEKRGYGWDVNPWVWVIEFKLVESDNCSLGHDMRG